MNANVTCPFPRIGMNCSSTIGDELGAMYQFSVLGIFILCLIIFTLCYECILYNAVKFKKLFASFESKIYTTLIFIAIFGAIRCLNYFGLMFSNLCYFFAGVNIVPGHVGALSLFQFTSRIVEQFHSSRIKSINNHINSLFVYVIVVGVVVHSFADNFCYHPVHPIYPRLCGVQYAIYALCLLYMTVLSTYTLIIWRARRVSRSSTVLILIITSLTLAFGFISIASECVRYLTAPIASFATTPSVHDLTYLVVFTPNAIITFGVSCMVILITWTRSILGEHRDMLYFRLQNTLPYASLSSMSIITTYLIMKSSSWTSVVRSFIYISIIALILSICQVVVFRQQSIESRLQQDLSVLSRHIASLRSNPSHWTRMHIMVSIWSQFISDVVYCGSI